MSLPHDFRALGKAPMPPPGVGGSPLQLSGSKLQENFEYLDKKEVEIPEAGETIYHDWKVTAIQGSSSWYTDGGTVYSQGAPINVEGISGGGAGYVLLKITRNASTREITSAVIEFLEDIPTSDSTYQYRPLAYVSLNNESVTQYQFEEIRIFEDLAIVNGEFQLVGLEMSHRNYYDAPP